MHFLFIHSFASFCVHFHSPLKGAWKIAFICLSTSVREEEKERKVHLARTQTNPHWSAYKYVALTSIPVSSNPVVAMSRSTWQNGSNKVPSEVVEVKKCSETVHKLTIVPSSRLCKRKLFSFEWLQNHFCFIRNSKYFTYEKERRSI